MPLSIEFAVVFGNGGIATVHCRKFQRSRSKRRAHCRSGKTFKKIDKTPRGYDDEPESTDPVLVSALLSCKKRHQRDHARTLFESVRAALKSKVKACQTVATKVCACVYSSQTQW